ncbi:MAG: FtsX-like permease family protein, partial [Candidatus Hydrogenedentes bacterium]|nr:FtsX-like permease family protein [Candidatus Hydrogenedentota bacterium]
RIVYTENILLSTVGLLVGLPLGLGLSRLLINAYDTEMFRMPFHIEPKTFVMACFWIAVFVALANLAARRKLHNLDMVEVLKERE